MAGGENDSGRGLKHLLRLLAEAGDWVYAAFWKLADNGRTLSWSSGYYNGPQMMGKDGNAGGAVLETLKEAFESRRQALDQLTEMTLTKKKPGTEAASMLTAGLMETEWFYVNNTGMQFPLGSGVVGRCALSGKYAWLCEADKMDSATFTRAADAKAAGIKTILCVPVQGGVVELGTTKLAQEETLLVKMVQTMFSTHSRPSKEYRGPFGGFIRSNPLGGLCHNPSAALCHASGATFGHSINGLRAGTGCIDYSQIRPGLPRSTGTEQRDYFASTSFSPKVDRAWALGSGLSGNCVTPTASGSSLPMSAAARLLYNPPTAGLMLMPSDMPAAESSVGTTGMKGKSSPTVNLCHRQLNNGVGINPAGQPLQGINSLLRGLDPTGTSFAHRDNPKDARLLLPADQIVAAHQARTANAQVLFNRNILKGNTSLCIPSLQGLSTPINPSSCSNYAVSLQAEIRRQQQQQQQHQQQGQEQRHQTQQFGGPVFVPMPNSQQQARSAQDQEKHSPVDISHVRHNGADLANPSSKGLTHLYSLPGNNGAKLSSMRPSVTSQSYLQTPPGSTAASFCDMLSQDQLSQSRHSQAVLDNRMLNQMHALRPLDAAVPSQGPVHWPGLGRGDGTLLDVVLHRSSGTSQRIPETPLDDPYFLSGVHSSAACPTGALAPDTNRATRAKSDLQQRQTSVEDVLSPVQNNPQELDEVFRHQQQPEGNSPVNSPASRGGAAACNQGSSGLLLNSGKESVIDQQLAEDNIEQHLKELSLPCVGETGQADTPPERRPGKDVEDDLVKLVRQHSKRIVQSPEISGTSASCQGEPVSRERNGSISRQGSFGSLGSLTSKRQHEATLTEKDTTRIREGCSQQEERFSSMMLPSSPVHDACLNHECDQGYRGNRGPVESDDPEANRSQLGCSPQSLLTGAGSNHRSEARGQVQMRETEVQRTSFGNSSFVVARVGLDFAAENPLVGQMTDWRLESKLGPTEQQVSSSKEQSESSDALFDTDGDESSSSSSSRHSQSEGMSDLTGLFPNSDKAEMAEFFDQSMSDIGHLQKEIGGGELSIERGTPVSLSCSRESEGSSDVGLLGGLEGSRGRMQHVREDKWCPADVSTLATDSTSASSMYSLEYEMRVSELRKLMLSETDRGMAADAKAASDKVGADKVDDDLACNKSVATKTDCGERMNGKQSAEEHHEPSGLSDVEVEFHVAGDDRINFRLSCRKQCGLYGKVMLALDYLRVKIVEATMTTENSMVVFELSILYGGSPVQDILNALRGAAQEEWPLLKPPRSPQVRSQAAE